MPSLQVDWARSKVPDKVVALCSDSAQNVFQHCMRDPSKLYDVNECLLKQLNEMDFCISVYMKKYQTVSLNSTEIGANGSAVK